MISRKNLILVVCALLVVLGIVVFLCVTTHRKSHKIGVVFDSTEEVFLVDKNGKTVIVGDAVDKDVINSGDNTIKVWIE